MRTRKKPPKDYWPSVRYGPRDNEFKICYSEEDVPYGWTRKNVPFVTHDRPAEHYDREELIRQLEALGVKINPIWSSAHMKKVLEG